MDKYALRRSALKRLVDSFGHGGISRVASKIGKEPNYVSRMLYPDDKPGRKRIGEDSVELLSREFPGWIEQVPAAGDTLGTHPLADFVLVDEAYPRPAVKTVLEVKEAAANFDTKSFPFTLAGTPSLEWKLHSIQQTLDSISPLLKDAARSAVMKWLHGEAGARDVARTIDALVEASLKIDQRGSDDQVPEMRIHQTAQ